MEELSAFHTVGYAAIEPDGYSCFCLRPIHQSLLHQAIVPERKKKQEEPLLLVITLSLERWMAPKHIGQGSHDAYISHSHSLIPFSFLHALNFGLKKNDNEKNDFALCV